MVPPVCIVHWLYSTVLIENYSFILTIIENTGTKKSCNKTFLWKLWWILLVFLSPWIFFNSYEEQNDHIGKARTEIGLVIQELAAYLCMVTRALQTWERTLISHWGNRGKIAAARPGWDIRYFCPKYFYEGWGGEEGEVEAFPTSSIQFKYFHTLFFILKHASFILKALILSHRSNHIFL